MTMKTIKLGLASAITALLITAPAKAELIDSFNSGDTTVTTSGQGGIPVYNYFSDAGILGGERLIRVRDGWSGTLGCCNNMTVENSAITNWGGNTAAESSISYGSAINYNGQVSDGLNLSLSLDTLFEFDSINGDADEMSISVNLLSGTGSSMSWFSNSIAVGTTSILLSDFTSANALALADVDGISIQMHSKNVDEENGLTFQEFRFAESTPVNDVPEPTSLAVLALGLLGMRFRRVAK